MYTIRLKIQQDEYFNALADKRFALINRCHNVLVGRARHLLNRLKHDPEYKALQDAYHKAVPGSREAREIGSKMNTYRDSIGLSKAGLYAYISVWQRRHAANISSHQAQKEAERVLAGVEAVLFGSGKELHFRPLSQATTLCSKSPKNGVAFDRENMTFRWIKDTFRLKTPDPDNTYIMQALYPDGTAPLPISYCEIKRLIFPNGWHYYLVLYVKGTAPQKHPIGSGTAGIDPGTSTMAVDAGEQVLLRELAPCAKEYVAAMKKTLKAMDRSRRDSNPDCFDSMDRAVRGKYPRNKSRRYRQLERKYQSLCRRKAAYIRQSHCILANEVLALADDILVEHMDYRGLGRRAKETSRQEKTSTMTDRRGREKTIHKYRRKKRFGKSLETRAPAEFLALLKQKAEAAGGRYREIRTGTFRASQYDHVTDACTKVPLKQRYKDIVGTRVQRDLYSAFLIRHANEALDAPDRNACLRDFARFAEVQASEIAAMKAAGLSMPACFGF
jgi:hypothetical protein